MTETATLTEVLGVIDGLGRLGSGARLRERLAQLNIQGVRRDSEDCPVCRYLEKETGWRFSVGPDEIAGWRGGQPVRVVVESPPAVQQFTARFDKGFYKELIC